MEDDLVCFKILIIHSHESQGKKGKRVNKIPNDCDKLSSPRCS